MANGWGLYDMAANVDEWCGDWYAPDYYASSPVEDPGGPAFGSARVVRGGDFYSLASQMRCAWRWMRMPDARDFRVGFRLVAPHP